MVHMCHDIQETGTDSSKEKKRRHTNELGNTRNWHIYTLRNKKDIP